MKDIVTWYHVALTERRQQITEEGLLPNFGGGFSNGKSPLHGTQAPLKAVYLTQEPGNIGMTSLIKITELHDVWQVNIPHGYSLIPDYPALVEYGAYVDQEGIYFLDDPSYLHEIFGDVITWEDIQNHPSLFIDLTKTAACKAIIPPQYLSLLRPCKI